MNIKEMMNSRKLKAALKDASSDQIKVIIDKLETIFLEQQEAENLAKQQEEAEQQKLLHLRQEVINSGVDISKMMALLSQEKVSNRRKTPKRKPVNVIPGESNDAS